MATAIISGGRAFRTATPVFSIPPWSRLKPLLPIEIGLLRHSRAGRWPSPTQKAPSRSAQADRRPKAPGGRIHSAGRPTPDRRLSRRLKSAFQGAPRRASAFADAKGTFPVGAGRPSAEGPWRPNSFGAHTDRRPEAFMPIEIGLLRRCAPGVGLRQRKRHLPGRRRPTVGRRPREAEFIRHTGRPPAPGPPGRIHSTPPAPRVSLQPGLPHPPTHLRPYQPQKGKAPPYSIARRTCATSASSGASPAAAQARR
jgi:hypothetical protein